MKKKAVFIMIIALVCIAMLGACCQTGAGTDMTGIAPLPSAQPSASAEPSETPSETPAEATPEQTPEASPEESDDSEPAPPDISPESFVFEEQTYEQELISISYPQITGYSDSEVQDALNQILMDTAMQSVDELEEGTEYELYYEVSLNTPDVISVWFDGYYYVPDTAHPSLLLFGVTIDVPSQQTVTLDDLVTVDSALILLLQGGEIINLDYEVTDEISQSISGYLEDEETLLTELASADTSIWSAASYLTPDALVVSISVAHAMGDHIEISLLYDDLAQVKTDNTIWDALGK